jgi:hypothetical protein
MAALHVHGVVGPPIEQAQTLSAKSGEVAESQHPSTVAALLMQTPDDSCRRLVCISHACLVVLAT